jgi:hypothetical protein
LEQAPVAAREAAPQVPAGEYQAVLDDMVDAMNVPAEASAGASSKKPKSARATKAGIAASTVITGIGSP